ncbi:MAG: NADH-quinone oxidoreductase subunit J, partial [Chloroflexi bacterium CFX6]|nr:NADH-quinone oxidoreductase subunit J [Chloroflexi bacterium CFX6]
MTPEALGFYAVAAVMVVAAVGMVAARNVVHGVLLMIVNFVGTTVLYLWLQAPFIAAVQLIVYAGAIMVLFLFVVMLLGARGRSLSEPLAGQRLWGVALAAVLGGLL